MSLIINTLQYDARYIQRHINTLQYDARYIRQSILQCPPLRKAYAFGRQSALKDDVEKILHYFKETGSTMKTSDVFL